VSNFTTFFGKYTELIERLSNTFPRYKDIIALCYDEAAVRIRQNVEAVYVDPFQVFHSAVTAASKETATRLNESLMLRPSNWIYEDLGGK
jgi:hypothetical protein